MADFGNPYMQMQGQHIQMRMAEIARQQQILQMQLAQRLVGWGANSLMKQPDSHQI